MKLEEKIIFSHLVSDPNPKVTKEHDLYGFLSDVEMFKKYLEQRLTPYSIGIYGNWGSGKTTFKNFLIEAIQADENSNVIPFDFIAWQYEQQTGILIPLIRKLINKTSFDKDKIKTISSVIALAFSNILLKASTATMVDVHDVVAMEQYAKENFSKYAEYVDSIEKTKTDFQTVIEGIISKEKKARNKVDRLVIFVDELDRCNPENTIKLLESIKNFFDVKGCIFVILVDDRILASYIDKKYEGTRMDGQMYLEKIINSKFDIPRITQTKLNRLWDKLKPDLNIDFNISIFPQMPKAYNPRKIAKLIEKLKLLDQRIETLEEKNLSPEFKSIEEDQRRQLIFLVIILHEIYPKIYRDINSWGDNFISKLKTFTMEFSDDPSKGFEKIKPLIDYAPDEIILLNYIFEIFEPTEIFREISDLLKVIQVI